MDHIAQDLNTYALVGRSVVVGVSGGRDSMLLLHYLHRLPIRLIVAHVNYGLRGAASAADENVVRSYCVEHDLTLEVYRVQPNEMGETSIQASARNIRYRFFEALMQQYEAAAVAIAHHQDDQLETILFQFLRGGGLASLRGMHRIADGIWRPLLDMTRTQIDEQVALLQVPYRDDASNFSDEYSRNGLRLRVIPELNALVPQWQGALLQRASIIQEVEEFIATKASRPSDWLKEESDGSYRLNMSEVLAMPLPYYSLWSWTSRLGLPSTAPSTIVQLWHAKTGAVVEFNGWRILKERNCLRVVPQLKREEEVHCIALEDLPCDVRSWRIELNQFEHVKNEMSEDLIVMKLESMQWPLEIRGPQMEDEIQPFGMKGHKRVSRLLIQKKVERQDKPHIRLWTHGKTVYWVEGLVVSELCRATDGDEVVVIKKNYAHV